MTTPTINRYDIDRLIEEARLQRSAAIGRALVKSAETIGTAIKSAFGFDRPLEPMATRHTLNLSSLGNER
jgi:hypothetical protein